jgi:hypothetical protein
MKSTEQHILSMNEQEKKDYLFRFMYLTLGYYSTEYNYDSKNIVFHPITGEPCSGIMHDRGHDAKEAMDLVRFANLVPKV